MLNDLLLVSYQGFNSSSQVYDDVPPFSTEQAADMQDSFSYHQSYEQAYQKGFVPHQEVLKAVINPNMTVSLTR